ncbi:MAG: alternative ribosome rescue aminoacyl-tRNA hydrolase ArfB [Actinomycetota bacterium]
MTPLRVTRSVSIPDDELEFKFSTSGGPGGQHANKAATRVDLRWVPETSRALGPRQRERVLSRLAKRLDSSGALRLSSDRYRSQLRNRTAVLGRLAEMVEEALRPAARRVATKPTSGAVERRLNQKRRRGAIKKMRTRPSEGEL